MKNIYALTAEDLSHLGGPMGTEYTEDMWTKYFDSIEKAKAYAEKHYKKDSYFKIKWKKKGNTIQSDDLGWVMYYIKLVKLEK